MRCVTLLSDLGLADAAVAIARGVLMQHVPGVAVVDVSHEVAPFQTMQAGYVLGGAWRHYAAGSCHVVLCDLFCDKTVRVLVAAHEGHYFISADNGVVPAATGGQVAAWVYAAALPEVDTYAQWLHAAGRLAAALLGGADVAAMGLPAYKLRGTAIAEPVAADNEVACEVLHIDRYENVVLNMTRERLEALRQGRAWRMVFVQVEELAEVSANYGDVRPGIKLCRYNSHGYMELCVNRGKAASLFGLRLGGKNNGIKIIFE